MGKERLDVSDSDVSTMARALSLEERFGSGIFPRGGPQTAHFRRLVRFGMLEFTGELGRDIDAEVDDDVPIYKLTDAGRAWIQERENAAASALAEPSEASSDP